MMANFNASGTEEQVENAIIALARRIDESRNSWRATLRSRKFWIGFLYGVIAMALLNLGDIHLCVGECDGEGFSIQGMWGPDQ
jgi:hypothetical protein